MIKRNGNEIEIRVRGILSSSARLTHLGPQLVSIVLTNSHCISDRQFNDHDLQITWDLANHVIKYHQNVDISNIDTLGSLNALQHVISAYDHIVQ